MIRSNAYLISIAAAISRGNSYVARLPAVAFDGRIHFGYDVIGPYHRRKCGQGTGYSSLWASTDTEGNGTSSPIDSGFVRFDANVSTVDNENNKQECGPSRGKLLHWALNKSVESALNGINKKNASLKRELEKAESLESTMARTNLIISNLYRLPPGTKSAEVEDWDRGGEVVELILNTNDFNSAQEEADALFVAARKMKRGSAIIMDLMEELTTAKDILRDAKQDLDAAESRATEDSEDIDEGILVLVQERLERTSAQTNFQAPNINDEQEQKQQLATGGSRKQSSNRKYEPNFRELRSPSGLKILIGRNRRDNEAICFQAARRDDIWMHARGVPGAHVLLCVRRGGPKPLTEDLQFAANLAAFYSDARTETKAPITTAEPKHIQKPRGAPPGAVKLRQEGQTLAGRPADVPEELKSAREESGGAWDEMGYRKLGTRAKNKKRTAVVEKRKSAKIRAEKKEKNKRRKCKQEGGG